MIRRSTARRGNAPPETATAADDHETPDDAPRPRAGSGGRWWVWVGRAVLWAFIIVVIFNGIWQPLRNGLATPPEQKESSGDEPAFPKTAASAFAARFADAYLNAGEDAGTSATERAEAISDFVPDGEAESLDLPDAKLTGENVQAVAVDAKDDHNGVVTLSADVNDTPMSLDVPVYAADSSSLVVSGQPALLPTPSKAELPEDSPAGTDDKAGQELEGFLEPFFKAYAETPDQLSQYIEDGAKLEPLPSDTLTLSEVSDITVPPKGGGSDDVRKATATVVWELAGEKSSELTQSYEVTVVKDGGKWYVRDVRGAPKSFGQ